MIQALEVCIFVVGLAYAAICESSVHVYPVGICHPVDSRVIYCTATQDEFMGRLQPYHPEKGGTNCFYDPITNDPTCDRLGGGTPTDSAYGWAVACPQGMFQKVIEFKHAGKRQCLDHGGEIRLRFGELYTYDGFGHYWYFPFDVLIHEPATIDGYPEWMWLLVEWKFVDK